MMPFRLLAVAGIVASVQAKPTAILENYCFSCHDEWESKGNIRLDDLDKLPLEGRLELLNKVQEQVYFGQMPPKKKKKDVKKSRFPKGTRVETL